MSKNIEDDFYILYEDCISCGLCVDSAPSLFDFSKDGNSFVKSQPENDHEIRLFLSAVQFCPVEAPKYRGKNQDIKEKIQNALTLARTIVPPKPNP